MSKSKLVATLVVPLMVLSVFLSLGGANASAAKSSKPKVIVATGRVMCRKVTGSIALSPPLQKGGYEAREDGVEDPRERLHDDEVEHQAGERWQHDWSSPGQTMRVAAWCFQSV